MKIYRPTLLMLIACGLAATQALCYAKYNIGKNDLFIFQSAPLPHSEFISFFRIGLFYAEKRASVGVGSFNFSPFTDLLKMPVQKFEASPRLYQNATIMPFVGTMDAFTGGLFTEGGEFVNDSVVYRGKAPEYVAAVDELAGKYIYGGCLFAHFGHFIWESLARVPAFYAREYPILFISPNEKIFETWRLFFKSLGIRNRFVVIRKPTRVENLVYLPPQTSLSPARMSEEALNALGRKEFGETSDKKIWLSRSKLKYGRIINEPAIEKCVQRLGFEIVYPEKLPLSEQIRLIATSRVVAGFSGSQFFSSFFAKKILGTYKIFNRRPRVPDTISFMLESKKITGELVTLAVKEAVPGAPEKNMVALEPDKIVATLAKFA